MLKILKGVTYYEKLSPYNCVACSFVALILLFQLSPPLANAESYRLAQDNNVFEPSIVEYSGENYEIIRSYNLSDGKLTNQETKSLLLQLGMGAKFIENMSYETINYLSTCESIVTNTSYIKTDESGITYLPKDTALKEAIELSQIQNAILSSCKDVDLFTANPANDIYRAFFDTSYISLTHTVAYDGNAEYTFITSAIWLTMPLYRNFDSLGSCAMGCTVVPGSQYGYFLYVTNYYANGELISTEDYFENITNYGNAVNGNWYGSAGYFCLPSNELSSSVRFNDFCAYYQYTGHVHDPESAKWINSVGSYEHTTAGLVIAPGISIEFGGSTTATIVLNVFVASEMYPAEVEFYYTPD